MISAICKRILCLVNEFASPTELNQNLRWPSCIPVKIVVHGSVGQQCRLTHRATDHGRSKHPRMHKIIAALPGRCSGLEMVKRSFRALRSTLSLVPFAISCAVRFASTRPGNQTGGKRVRVGSLLSMTNRNIELQGSRQTRKSNVQNKLPNSNCCSVSRCIFF